MEDRNDERTQESRVKGRGIYLAKIHRLFIFLFGVLCINPEAAVTAEIFNYEPTFELRRQKGQIHVIIREFMMDGVATVMTVDADTGVTSLRTKKSVRFWMPVSQSAAENSVYIKNLNRHAEPPFPLSNDGLTRNDERKSGWFLTVDMCQSSRAFEKEMYQRVAEMGRPERPIPVAICMTGRWLKERPEEFAWLKTFASSDRVTVTWVNHSVTHPYQRNTPYKANFLLSKGVRFVSEVLDNEIIMLENGLLPSVFFRFPGLVSSSELVGKLRELGLITLGADAWLNIGQQPTAGSILLIHGNGNEPGGIQKFYDLIENSAGKNDPEFLPISEALSRGE